MTKHNSAGYLRFTPERSVPVILQNSKDCHVTSPRLLIALKGWENENATITVWGSSCSGHGYAIWLL